MGKIIVGTQEQILGIKNKESQNIYVSQDIPGLWFGSQKIPFWSAKDEDAEALIREIQNMQSNLSKNYTWIRFADEEPVSPSITIYETPRTTTKWMGISVNNSVDSLNGSYDYLDYKWIKIAGNDGKDGNSIQLRGTVNDWVKSDSLVNTSEDGSFAIDDPIAHISSVANGVIGTHYPEAGEGYMLSNKDHDLHGHLIMTDGNTWFDCGEIQGPPGENGKAVTIISQYVTYQISNSGNEEPTGTWSSSIPATNPGDFLWTKTTVNYSDGTSVVSYSISRDGRDGITIVRKTATYAITKTNVKPLDSDFIHAEMPEVTIGDYLWVRDYIVYSNGEESVIYSVSRIGTDGEQGIPGAEGYTTHFAYASSADGLTNFSTTLFPGAIYIGSYRDQNHEDSQNYKDYHWAKLKGDDGDSVYISSQDQKYQVSSSGIDVPTGAWVASVPEVPAGKFLWTRNVVNYSDGTTTTTYTVSRNGENLTISEKSIQYAKTETNTKPNDDQFADEMPLVSMGDFLWIKEIVTYSDGQSLKSYSVSRIGADGPQGIPGANGTRMHMAYASSSDGSMNFSRYANEYSTFIGTYIDNLEIDSDDYHDYNWARILGPQGPQGVSGNDGKDGTSVSILGSKTDVALLPSGGNSKGDGYIVNSDLWVWDGTQWVNCGQIVGPQGEKPYIHFAWANDLEPNYNDFTISVSSGDEYVWQGHYTDYTEADSLNPADYKWIKVKGPQGEDGEDGIGIDTTEIRYARFNSGTQAPTTGWVPGVPPLNDENRFLWTRTTQTYTDGTSSISYSVSYHPKDGEDLTISEEIITYAVSDVNVQPNNDQFVYTTVPALGMGQYLWTRVRIIYSDDTEISSYTVQRLAADGTDGIPGANGYTTHIAWSTSADGLENFNISLFEGATYMGAYTDQNTADSEVYTRYTWTKILGPQGESGKDGVTITSKSVRYIGSQSGTNAPSDNAGWNTVIPTVEPGNYLWTKTTITYSDGDTVTSYSVSYIPQNGEDGKDGKDLTISQKSVQYATTKTNVQPDDNEFENVFPTVGLGDYLWEKVTITYVDGNTISSYAVSRIGTDGEQGAPGADGYSVHIAYATSLRNDPNTGKLEGFSTTYFDGAVYIGIYRDKLEADSDDSSRYNWSKLKGEDGANGTSINIKGSFSNSNELPLSPTPNNGDAYTVGLDLWVWTGESWQNCGQFKGQDGQDGQSSYIHYAWTNELGPTWEGFTIVNENINENEFIYMGYYVDHTITDSETATKYTWVKLHGDNGKDGVTTYTWIKYADDADGNNMSDSPIYNAKPINPNLTVAEVLTAFKDKQVLTKPTIQTLFDNINDLYNS